MIKNLSLPIVETTIKAEPQTCDLHVSVIDFLSLFKPFFTEKEQIFEEIFNSNADFMGRLLSFNAEIIAMHEIISKQEILQTFKEEILLPEALDIEKVVELSKNNQLNEVCRDNSESIIDSLTLKVSNQPWVVSPDYENYYSDIAKVFTATDLISPHVEQFDNINPIDITTKTDKAMQVYIDSSSIDYCNLQSTLQKCSSSKLSFNPESNIEKYQAISDVVHNQVMNKVMVHNFASSDTIEIELYPEKLGKVKIKCNIEEDAKVIIQVSAERLSTLSLLQQNSLELKEVIERNFQDSKPLSSDLSFEMSDSNSEKQNQQERTAHSLTHNLNNDKINTLVYFLHNGIINLVV